MEPRKPSTLLSTLAGTGMVSLIIWAGTLTAGVLAAMFRTRTGHTSSLFRIVFFEANESTHGTDFSLGIESFPRALILLGLIWILAFVIAATIQHLRASHTSDDTRR